MTNIMTNYCLSKSRRLSGYENMITCDFERPVTKTLDASLYKLN